MFNALLKFSLERRLLVMGIILLVCGLGVWNFQRLAIDAVPDITNVQVVINTEAPGFTPLEIEQRVSTPLETAMAGLSQLRYTRSLSRYGLSQITLIFNDETDIYFARQQVAERLLSAAALLPKGLSPSLGPVSTGLGEIFMFTVDFAPGATHADGSAITPTDLRSVHDWIIRPQLLRVPGVVEVNPIGGYKREILVALDPVKLLALRLTQEQVIAALERSNNNRGLGFVERNGAQVLMRMAGQFSSLEEIGETFLLEDKGLPILIKDVAQVEEGVELRTGAATQNGREVVMSTVMMLRGENSRAVALQVAEQLKQIQPSLPSGISLTPVYDRTRLVNATLATVSKNLLEGALLVVAVLFFSSAMCGQHF